MNIVKILDNVIEQQDYVTHETELNVADFLATIYEEFPRDARIYHEKVCGENDVTPYDANSIEALKTLKGTFYVVTLPQAPVLAFVQAYGAYIAMAVAIVAAVVMSRQAAKIPNAAAANNIERSGNNELSNRTNKARLWKRIPDIYGNVISVPDLLAQPYKIYEKHIEREYSLMCIGRGEYDIANLNDIKDDTTPIKEIDGASVEIFKPGNLTTPKYRVGKPITERFLNVRRSNSVNGQVLKPYNKGFYDGTKDMYARAGGYIGVEGKTKNWFGQAFQSLDQYNLADTFKVGERVLLNLICRDVEKIEIDTSTKITTGPFSINFFGTDAELANIRNLELNKEFYITALYTTRITSDKKYYGTVSGFFTVVSVEPMRGRSRERWWEQDNAFLGYKVTVKESVVVGDAGFTERHFTKSKPLIMMRVKETIDLTEYYTIEAINGTELKLKDAQDANPNWARLTDATKKYSSAGNCSVRETNTAVVGPFICDYAGTNIIMVNVVAMGGLFKSSQDGEEPVNVEVRLRAVEVDMQGNEIGGFFETTGFVEGKIKSSATRALTLKLEVPSGRYKISLWRTTPHDTEFKGNVVDEVKWRDLYYGTNLDFGDLGNITIVKSITNATDGALAVKNRKLNIRVTRMIPKRIGPTAFSTEIYPTSNAAEIFCAICLDPVNGGRTVDELDVENIYSTIERVRQYFGLNEAIEFNYTFDSTDIGFEEMIQSVANTAFCTAYRVGERIKLTPDIDDKLPVMIFNHRNKFPGTEKRTINFGTPADHDGIEFKYVDPADGSQTEYRVPEDARKYKKVDSIGITNHRQAYLHAWRQYNILKYQRIVCEFDALAEADLLVVRDRASISDNTKFQYSEGEVLKQEGVKLTLSGEVRAGVGHYIFLQHWNRTTESIKIIAVDGNVVTLERPPSFDLSADDINFVNSVYYIEQSDKTAANKQFILSEKKPADDLKVSVKFINYDKRYYKNDHDYMNGNNPYSG